MENSSGLFSEIRIFTICKALHNDMKPALSGILLMTKIIDTTGVDDD